MKIEDEIPKLMQVRNANQRQIDFLVKLKDDAEAKGITDITVHPDYNDEENNTRYVGTFKNDLDANRYCLSSETSLAQVLIVKAHVVNKVWIYDRNEQRVSIWDLLEYMEKRTDDVKDFLLWHRTK